MNTAARELRSYVPGARAFQQGHCFVLVSIDDGKQHLSISRRTRYPTWDEIKRARYTFLPDGLTMAMLLPPKNEYVNIHQNCFHLWQIEP